MSFEGLVADLSRRHPERVSGSTVQRMMPVRVEPWMPKQVRQDGIEER
jgi:hypothetical protein